MQLFVSLLQTSKKLIALAKTFLVLKIMITF